MIPSPQATLDPAGGTAGAMGILSPSRGKERHPYHQVRTGSDAGDLSSQPTVQEIEARVLPMAHENPSPPLEESMPDPILEEAHECGHGGKCR